MEPAAWPGLDAAWPRVQGLDAAAVAARLLAAPRGQLLLAALDRAARRGWLRRWAAAARARAAARRRRAAARAAARALASTRVARRALQHWLCVVATRRLLQRAQGLGRRVQARWTLRKWRLVVLKLAAATRAAEAATGTATASTGDDEPAAPAAPAAPGHAPPRAPEAASPPAPAPAPPHAPAPPPAHAPPPPSPPASAQAGLESGAAQAPQVPIMPCPSQQALVLSPGRTPDAERCREQFALRAALSVSPAASPRSVLFYDAIQTAPSSPVGSCIIGMRILSSEPDQVEGDVPARPEAEESAQPQPHVPARPRAVAAATAAPFARAPAAHAPTASASRARAASARAPSARAAAPAERAPALGAIARRRARHLLLAGFRWWRLAVAVLRATELLSCRSRAQRAHVELGPGLLLPRLQKHEAHSGRGSSPIGDTCAPRLLACATVT